MEQKDKKILESFNDLLKNKKIMKSAIYLTENIDDLKSIKNKNKEYIRIRILEKLNSDKEWVAKYKENLFLASLLLHAISIEEGFENLIKAIELSSDIGDKIEVFWNIVRYYSIYKNEIKKDTYVNETFMNIVNYINKNFPIIVHEKVERKNEEFELIIITNQLLNLNHAPTRETLEYAKGFKELGYKVLVFVTNEMPHSPNLMLANAFVANIDKNNKKRLIINYEKNEIIVEFLNDRAGAESIKKATLYLSNFNPKYIFSVGGYNFIAELMGRNRILVNLPCVAELCASMFAKINFFWYGNDTIAKNFINKYSLNNQEIECNIVPRFAVPKSEKKLNPEEFNIDISKKIGVIVGNRLNEEIDDEFLQTLQYLNRNSELQFIIIGSLNEDKKAQIYEYLESNTLHINFYENLFDIYMLCDFYLNPKRMGGGTAAAYAMASGLPVYSLKYGDVGKLVLAEDCFTTYSEMRKIEIQIKKRSDNYKKSQKIINRFEELSNKNIFMNEINKLILRL